MADFFDHLNDILFLDIETASLTEKFEDLPERIQEEWLKKERLIQSSADQNEPGDLYFDRAGIHAEFGQVVCVGVGYFQWKKKDKKLVFRSKCYADPEERELLLEFKALLEKKKWILCAHNGKEFDFPYLCRRMLVQGIALPEPLQIAGKKPWEVRHLDTMELWKFGDYKHYTRLELLASIFAVPSSKDDLDGSQVNTTFHLEKDVEKIKKYCLKDVEVTARVFLAMHPQQEELEIEIIQLEDSKKDHKD
ncbi:3'-5' exonuclease [Algoriphagus halophytocola]|uniref:3'-5' exonuclease n=1 Tax=Algoriphagus halophytocola TaxID=2991499 RepID=A0ABY6MEJ9_9BACT|nr:MULTISPECIES: 3'-5' exonuclease [unclassified Algoriphagus]UZD22215.1 3'-5' exonuclease [Algoriphagus sp. TR-M5]WBL43465.1 3'-5' exonuclease [Algoriphagus sp. TR-M9]